MCEPHEIERIIRIFHRDGFCAFPSAALAAAKR